jgi:hypothetical protein
MLDWADKGFVEGFFVVMLWSKTTKYACVWVKC